MTEQEICDYIREHYMHMNGAEMAEVFGWYMKNGKRNSGRVCSLMRKMGISSRPTESHYFETIDTSEKAYLFGLLSGDGGIDSTGTGFTLGFKREDRYMLEAIASIFHANGIRCTVRDYDKTNSSQLIVRSRWECSYLMNLGILPSKSYVGTDKIELPKGFEYEFMLGLLDSDGCVPVASKPSEYSVRLTFMQYHKCYGVLRKIYAFLEKEGFRPAYHEGDDHTINVCGYYAVELGKRMWGKSPLFLKRKYERFENRKAVFLEHWDIDWFEINRRFASGEFAGMNAKEIASVLGVKRQLIYDYMKRTCQFQATREEIWRKLSEKRERTDKGTFA